MFPRSHAGLAALAAVVALLAGPPSLDAQSRPTPYFGGEFRINGYSVDNGFDAISQQTAARLRFRQNIGMVFDRRFTTYVQFQLNHTASNIDATTEPVRIRHAVLDYRHRENVSFQAGIVPLSDRFGDALFSSNWDWNPLAVVANLPVASGLRLFAGNLSEGSETQPRDDAIHYQADLDLDGGENADFVLMGGLLRASDGATPRSHAQFGLGADIALSDELALNGFILGSRTDQELIGAADDGSGVALKVELEGGSDELLWSVMVTHATGGDAGDGFLPAMAFAGFNGYWGYTTIITSQQWSDTGFDGDAVNISNNGYGLTSLQARGSFPMADDLRGSVAAGWFGNSEGVARDGTVGIEAVFSARYDLTDVLGADFGFAVAELDDSVSGYARGASGGFNQAFGFSRTKWAAFLRLEALY